MKDFKGNLKKANQLVRLIGINNVWNVDAGEYNILLMCYKEMGTEEKLIQEGFVQVDMADDNALFTKDNIRVRISLNK